MFLQFCLLHIAVRNLSAPEARAILMQIAPSVCSSLCLRCSVTWAASPPSADLLFWGTITMFPVLLPSGSSFSSLPWLPLYRLRNCQHTFLWRFLKKESLCNSFHLIQFSLISMPLLPAQSLLMTLSSPDTQVILFSAFL